MNRIDRLHAMASREALFRSSIRSGSSAMSKRLVVSACIATVGALAAAAGGCGAAKDRAAESQRSGQVTKSVQSDTEQELSIKDIMKKAHKGEECLVSEVSVALHQDEPEWQATQKNVAELIRLGNMLTKKEPPKGSKDSWEQLTQGYVDRAKIVHDKLEQKDLPASRTAFDSLLETCKGCHLVHKPNAR